MPEYDAFGREIGEDTLQQWRQGSGAQPPEPATVAAPQPPPRQPGPRRVAFPSGMRPRRRRRGVRIVLLLVFAWLGYNLVSGIANKVDEVARTITIPNLSPPQAEPPPVGLEAGSLLRPAAFQRALGQIRRRGGGKLENLRVAPERIDATLITDRGTLVNVQVSATEGFRRFSESGPGFSASDAVPFGKLDPRIPQKVTRAAAKRLGASTDQINYLVPSLSDGKVAWGAYFKTGAIFIADARGRIIRRIS